MSTKHEDIILEDRTEDVRFYPNAPFGTHGFRGLFVWTGKVNAETRTLLGRAGWYWDAAHGVFATPAEACAYRVAPRHERLAGFARRLEMSWAEDADVEVPMPEGVDLLPYQRAGVDFAAFLFAAGLSTAYIADDMGLGKTPQALGLVNFLQHKRVLVVCPAHLRVNWAREVLKFSFREPSVAVFHQKRTTRNWATGEANYLICGYEAATKHTECLRAVGPFDLLVIDEAHALKSAESKRSKATLGTKYQEPLTSAAKQVLLLSGSPLPNRPAEIWTVLRALALHVIRDCLSLESFAERFGYFERDDFGYSLKGSKNEIELGLRLRGSLMIRRLKKDVLPQLPKKQYELVVFPPDSSTALVLKKEAAFSPHEIALNGCPAGSPLAEVRKEMGLAKLPVALEYIKGLLDGGLKKVVLFAHHRAVVEGLHEGLKGYGAVMVIGGLSDKARQAAVDAFQTQDNCRVIVLNLDAGATGLNLTAADTLIRVEQAWVDGVNRQAEDRICRFGQEADSLLIVDLVVQGSLDAAILGCATRKGRDVSKVLDAVRV